MEQQERYRPRTCTILRITMCTAIFIIVQTILAPLLPALDVPKLSGRVNDTANMISSAAESKLNEKLEALEASDSTQLVILTIPSLKGGVLEEFSMRVVEKWKIGQKEYDNGVLLLVSKNDRKVRIEVGYGLEGRLTDLLSGRIIDYEILPNFKAGRFNEGFIAGADAIAEAVRGEYKGKIPTVTGSRRSRVNFMPFIILIIVIAIIGSKKRVVGGIAGALLLPLVAWFSLSLGWALLLVMIPLGFAGGLILPGMYFFPGIGSGRRFYGGGGSSFGGGGFSGGGGGFGGGGASGGW